MQGQGSLAVKQAHADNYPYSAGKAVANKSRLSAWKEPCALASAAGVANLSNVLLSNFDGSTQGVTLTLGDRVLVKNSSSPDGVISASTAYCGIYAVISVAADGLHGALAYDTDGDTSDCYGTGQMVPVMAGTYAASLWMLTTANPITLGTTGLTYAAPTLG